MQRIKPVLSFFMVIVGAISSTIAMAQSVNHDVNPAITNLKATYLMSLGTEAPFFNGKIYYSYPHKLQSNGHPFFGSNQPVIGTLQYDDATYNNVHLMYDLLNDQAIALYQDGHTLFVLSSEKVNGFTLMNHKFINIGHFIPKGKGSPTGYYDLLFQGKFLSLVAKRSKTIGEVAENAQVIRTVKQHNSYYILSGQSLTEVTGKSSLLKFLKKRSNNKKLSLSSNGLSFKRDKENALVSMVKQFENTL